MAGVRNNRSPTQRALLRQMLQKAGASLQAADLLATDGPEQVRLKISFSSLKSRQLVDAVGVEQIIFVEFYIPSLFTRPLIDR